MEAHNDGGNVHGQLVSFRNSNEGYLLGYTVDSLTLNNYKVSRSFIARISSGSILSETQSDSKLKQNKIFPNPTSGKFTLQLNEQSQEGKVCVYDVLGNCVFNQQINNLKNQEIDLSSQAKGVYFVEINTGSEKINKKVVLN